LDLGRYQVKKSMKVLVTTLLLFYIAGAKAQYMPKDKVCEHAIRSVLFRFENKGKVSQEYKTVYNQDGDIEEEYNCHAGSPAEYYTRNFYHDKFLVKSHRYLNGVLHDSTLYHFTWTDLKREYENREYFVATGDSEITVQIFDYPKYNLKKLNNDKLNWEDIGQHYILNDSTKVTVDKNILYNRAPQPIVASNDSVIYQKLRNGYIETKWSDGAKVESIYTDTVSRNELETTFNKKGKTISRYECLTDEKGRKIKTIRGVKHKQTRYYQYKTSEKDGTRTDETLIYNDRRKVVERNVKSVTRKNGMRHEENITYDKKNRVVERDVYIYNAKNLPVENSSYDGKGQLIGRITWEYTYF